MLDPRVTELGAMAGRHLNQAGELLQSRQETRGSARGNVPPWPHSEEMDLHGTLAAVWIWSRSERLLGKASFTAAIQSAWTFVEQQWPKHLPGAIGPESSDEAAFDCAMLLRAFTGSAQLREPNVAGAALPQLAAAAARVLSAYLTDLRELDGREFRDPGFLAWSLVDYARAVSDRGLLSVGQKFVDRAFGMKSPPPFHTEPAVTDGLFDFSCTSATRVMAILSAEGHTPFVGAWLRERVVRAVPERCIERPLDQDVWNASLAALLGRAYVVSTDPVFGEAYVQFMAELRNRPTEETLPLFFQCLAMDAVVVGPP